MRSAGHKCAGGLCDPDRVDVSFLDSVIIRFPVVFDAGVSRGFDRGVATNCEVCN